MGVEDITVLRYVVVDGVALYSGVGMDDDTLYADVGVVDSG